MEDNMYTVEEFDKQKTKILKYILYKIYYNFMNLLFQRAKDTLYKCLLRQYIQYQEHNLPSTDFLKLFKRVIYLQKLLK